MEVELLSAEAIFVVGTSSFGVFLSVSVISRLEKKSLCHAIKNKSVTMLILPQRKTYSEALSV